MPAPERPREAPAPRPEAPRQVSPPNGPIRTPPPNPYPWHGPRPEPTPPSSAPWNTPPKGSAPPSVAPRQDTGPREPVPWEAPRTEPRVQAGPGPVAPDPEPTTGEWESPAHPPAHEPDPAPTPVPEPPSPPETRVENTSVRPAESVPLEEPVRDEGTLRPEEPLWSVAPVQPVAPERSEQRPRPEDEAESSGVDSEPFASSTFDPVPSAKGIEAWADIVDRTPPMPGGFEERIVNVRAVPASLFGRALFRVSFGRIKVG